MKFPLLLIIALALLTGACASARPQIIQPEVPAHLLPSYPTIAPPQIVMPNSFFPLCDLEECVDAC
jgi:hypothetical protein